MDFVQNFLILLLILSLTTGRTLFYDELDSDNQIDSYSDEYQGKNKNH
jgi:hypothetical protein